MSELEGRNIILGVTGGIAAYKAVEVASRLVKLGASVNVIMTKNATKLVQPATFRYISRNPVCVELFDDAVDWKPEHISLADKADLLVIAPATANIIGKLAHGIADDMLSTTALAVKCPIVVAPAMNCNMYDNSIVQENIKSLIEHGFIIIEPEYGQLACGYEGKGRLPEPRVIVEKIKEILTTKRDLLGKTVLVTAGPTQEPIDPIRFITNRSSGKMGYAVASACIDRGARVILITGPTSIPVPDSAEIIRVTTAEQMRDAVLERFAESDVVIMSAAVADYRPAKVSPQKIKKEKERITLELELNPDILAELGQRKRENQVIVGFSMETEDLIKNTMAKLVKKNADLMVANDVSIEGAGFASDTNIVTIIGRSGVIKELPKMTKYEVANVILDIVVQMISEKERAQSNPS